MAFPITLKDIMVCLELYLSKSKQHFTGAVDAGSILLNLLSQQ